MHTSLVWSESNWLHSHGVSIRSAFLFSSVVHSATDGTTGSGTGNQHSRELLSSQLKIAIKHLFVRLDDWCAGLQTLNSLDQPLTHTLDRHRLANCPMRLTTRVGEGVIWIFYFIVWTLTCNLEKVIYLITTSQWKKWPLRLSHWR